MKKKSLSRALKRFVKKFFLIWLKRDEDLTSEQIYPSPSRHSIYSDRDMTLGKKQELFSRGLCLLINYATFIGYEIRMGEVLRSKEEATRKGFPNSNHTRKLAADINLFRDGKYLSDTLDHLRLGEFWESLTGEYDGVEIVFAWGGRFKDGNHYSIQHGKVK